ncbi:PREDICTED: uncharacterized protein LOC109586744 [Amphimedon queenslandica]|uniref:TRP C-terminal domain-containing protein n=1 Tax=Amphimedon queenslandica TaxID=400682 RepID=A0A1X7TPD6_AMPQE|nr:PREDICTED: uncharacterized protein LOC109586744 [Amphimedon queenslandica]|eukprot:XP_019858508.1 PREDICTED: uncharacterized protein LOC109586744 [Amphimedon queenslandica]
MAMAKLLLALAVAQVLNVAGEILQIEVNGEFGNDTEDCLSGEEPCATLDYALNGTSSSISSVHYLLNPDVPHELRNNYSFYDGTNIGISSSLNGSRAYIECIGNNTGLSFDHSQNLIFRDIAFNHCGSSHVTTSNDRSKPERNFTSYLYTNITLFFIFCCDITFDGVVVNGSTGTGVVFYSTIGNNFILNSNFTYNRPVDDKPGGGGVAVEYIYCIPGDPSCGDKSGNSFNSTFSNGGSFTFRLCSFFNNEANTSSITGDSFIVPHANTNVALGRGAGLSLLHKGNITNSRIVVDSCTFSHNKAVWGGAMLIEFQDTSQENEVNITDCHFSQNKGFFNSCNYAGTGGGGVRVQFASFHDRVIKNKVRFINVMFYKNHAYFGGGLSFFTFPTYKDRSNSNNLFFYNCTWNKNIARLGSAIDLSLWNINGFSDGSLVASPYFEESTFVNNTIKYTKYYGTPTGIGAVYTDSVPLKFTGSNTFSGNIGSALVALDATIEFRNNSDTYFEDNEGLSGGAVTLFSKAFLLFGDNCNAIFHNNSATLHGGAISWQSVGDHQLISSRNCFIRYYDTSADPTDWNVTFNFDGNKAGFSGDAIFATSLLGCLWGGRSYGQLYDDTKSEYQTVFCWNSWNSTEKDIWNYDSDCNSTNLIATSPAYYFNEANGTVQCGKYDWYNISVVPGKPTKLDDVVMLDDRQNKISQDSVVYMYMYTTISNETMKSNTTYVTNEALPYNRTIVNETIHLGTIIPRVMATTVNLSFTSCPPGFSNKQYGDSCKRGSLPFVNIYSNFSADIQFGYWIGKINDDDSRYYVGECYFCPWNITTINGSRVVHQNYIHLPEDGTPLESFFCGGLNRNGTLCAKCKSNYCTAVNSLKYKCIDIGSHKHYYSYTWIFYLLFEYVPITLLMIVVIIFNVSVTSGPANAFIFFSQIISSTFSVDADGQINYETITHHAPGIKQAYIFLYGIWNLDFLNAIDYDGWLFCLSPKFGALQIMTLKYIAAAYPLVIIVLIVFLVWLYNKNYRFVVCLFRPIHWCTARCMRYLNIDRSLMDALATFLILSYVKFAVTACYILYPNPLVYDAAKHPKYVAYLDGNVDYGSHDHIPYLLISVVAVLWCILLPLILLFYSTRRCYTFLDKTKKFRWLEPGDLFYHFLNSFHHCFKDDRRYFAAFYFFLKLILIGTYALGFDWTKQYIYQQIVCTLAILLVGTLQPYREMKYNFLDMGMFSILAVVNVLSLYSRHQQAVNIPLSKITFYSQVILIFVPLVYFTLYSIYFIIRNVFRCRRRCNIGPDDDENEDEAFNNFMNDVEEEDRFETNHYYGGIADDEDAGQQRRRENEALFNRPSPDSVQFRSRRGRTEPLRSRYMPRRT